MIYETGVIYDIENNKLTTDPVLGQVIILRHGAFVTKCMLVTGEDGEREFECIEVIDTLVVVERYENDSWISLGLGNPWRMISENILKDGDLVRFFDEEGELSEPLTGDMDDPNGIYIVGKSSLKVEEDLSSFDDMILEKYLEANKSELEIDDVDIFDEEDDLDLEFISLSWFLDYIGKYSEPLKIGKRLIESN